MRGGPRSALRLGLLVMLGLMLLAPTARGANETTDVPPDETSEARFVELVAQERRAQAVGDLVVAPDLVGIARRHAQRMASEGRIYHNPNLANEVQDWQTVGENVGRGGSADDIHRAFMESSSHRTNIVEARFTQIGTGAVVSGGELWVVEVFRQPMAAAAPPPTAAPAPAPAPAPVPTAAPARPVRAARATPLPAPVSPPAALAAPVTTTPPPLPVRPPVAGLPAGPEPADAGAGAGAELALRPVSSRVPLPPPIPAPVKFAAALLVAVLAAEVLTFHRLALLSFSPR